MYIKMSIKVPWVPHKLFSFVCRSPIHGEITKSLWFWWFYHFLYPLNVKWLHEFLNFVCILVRLVKMSDSILAIFRDVHKITLIEPLSGNRLLKIYCTETTASIQKSDLFLHLPTTYWCTLGKNGLLFSVWTNTYSSVPMPKICFF